MSPLGDTASPATTSQPHRYGAPPSAQARIAETFADQGDRNVKAEPDIEPLLSRPCSQKGENARFEDLVADGRIVVAARNVEQLAGGQRRH